ncbi:MAG TPA: hypothetical protein ENO08_01140 [Candidatus Eisenbacteria bacterium]|uniref:Uncharacterized protein n=1 Tax=Eiseniibacteriota bacterium TaxID=2212470 RepID=A0A7V2ATM9_UNCEI|nr:hypothetical protein [Candidatus Eisenbacteria bacterium]
MFKAKAAFFAVSCVLASLAMLVMVAQLHAQCYGSLALSPDFFGYDYLVRICVHFGEISAIPYDIVCGTTLPPGGHPVGFPVYAYNLYDGIDYLEFSIESKDSLARFVPAGDFQIVSASADREDGLYRINLILEAAWPVCGPVFVGTAEVEQASGVDPIWVDLVPNRDTGEMSARDRNGSQHYLFSPKHGGYAGTDYLYTCQEPICPEPNLPVTDLSAVTGPGCSIKVGWTSGGGERTMVRYHPDHYPSGYEDGALLCEVQTLPGEVSFYYHYGIPQGQLVYYTAFSLTRDASGNIELDSFVECSAMDTVRASCVIAVEESSWSEIKSIYR